MIAASLKMSTYTSALQLWKDLSALTSGLLCGSLAAVSNDAAGYTDYLTDLGDCRPQVRVHADQIQKGLCFDLVQEPLQTCINVSRESCCLLGHQA